MTDNSFYIIFTTEDKEGYYAQFKARTAHEALQTAFQNYSAHDFDYIRKGEPQDDTLQLLATHEFEQQQSISDMFQEHLKNNNL
ncbi:MAG: hypothetical protein HOP31_12985 [Ignavibacteria bacterium]|nr:hypothetical protein [Ignavibacteria bacterium]